MTRDQLAVAACLPLLITVLLGRLGHGDVVIGNATPSELAYSIRPEAGTSWRAYRLKPEARHTYKSPNPLVIQFSAGGQQRKLYRLTQDRVYEFRIDSRGLSELYKLNDELDTDSESTSGDVEQTQPELRELKILALADQTHRKQFSSTWEDRIQGIVIAASKHYERNFGLRFTVTEVRPWEFQAVSGPSGEAFSRLFEIAPGVADIVVAFVAEKDRTFYRSSLSVTEGRAPAFGQYAIVSDITWNRNPAEKVLVHELGHVLGGFHVQDRQSIMYPDTQMIPVRFEFDAITTEIIRLTRNVDLRCGVDSLDEGVRSRIRDLFGQHRHEQEKPGADPVAHGYLYLAERARARSNLALSKTLLNKVIQISPHNAVAYAVLGSIALEQEDGIEAERCYRRALELDGENLHALVKLATVLLEKADLEGASTAVQRAIMAVPDHPDARMVRALCRYLRDDSEGLIEDLVFLDRASPSLAERIRTADVFAVSC